MKECVFLLVDDSIQINMENLKNKLGKLLTLRKNKLQAYLIQNESKNKRQVDNTRNILVGAKLIPTPDNYNYKK